MSSKIHPWLVLLVSALASPLSIPLSYADPSEPTGVLIISGGGSQDDNNFRYENNVRLFHNVLQENAYPKDSINVLFNEGKDSRVKDLDSKNPIFVTEEYEVQTKNESIFRPTRIKDLITNSAHLGRVYETFSELKKQGKAKKIRRVILFSTDHGTPNTNDYNRSYITLAGDQKLTILDEEKFVRKLAADGVKVVLIGAQCFSGHNTQIAIRQPNACAMSAAAPLESSYALTDKELPDGSSVPNLGYSTYAFYFSCALHNASVKNNQASAHCPPGESADFDKDGRVSFAEAHFYALTKMNSKSSPQISSMVYARTVLKQTLKKPEANVASMCLAASNLIEDLKKQISTSQAPSTVLQFSHRLATERAVIKDLLSEKSLRSQIEAKEADPLETVIEKLQKYHVEFEAGYQAIRSEITAALTAVNKNRALMADLRNTALQNALGRDNPSVKEDYKKLQAAEARLSDSSLTPEQLQIEQSNYNRYFRNVQNQIDAELMKPTLKKKYEDLNLDYRRKIEDRNIAQDREALQLASYANIRRAYEMIEGHYAETQILASGTAEQRGKLLQLYECEDQIL